METFSGILPRIVPQTFTTVADETRRFAMTGNQIYCRSGSNVKFRMFDANGSPITEAFFLSTGQKFTVDRAGYFVEVVSATIQTVTFQVSYGDFNDNSVIFAAGAVILSTPSATTRTDAAAVSAADAASTLIAAGNVADRNRYVSHRSLTATLYIQAAAGAASVGIPCAPGDVVILSDQSAIYARNDSGGAVNVYVTNERTT